MFGNLGELAKLMNTVKDIQSKAAELKREMAEQEFTASAGGDAVAAVVSGDFRVKSLVIRPGISAEELPQLTADAVNAALDCAKNHMQQRMSELSGGLKLPGLF